MIEPRTADLMEQELSGSLTAAERTELEHRLAEQPEARALLAEMREVGRHLTAAGEVETPAGLRGRILATVRERRPARTGGAAAWIRGLWPQPAPALRYASALAAGLLLGLGAAAWLSSGSLTRPDLDSLAGTMARRTPEAAPVDTLEVSLPGVEGRVVLRPSPAGFLLETELTAPEPVGVSLVFPAGEVEIRGFLDPEGEPAPFRVDPGQLSWTHVGHRRYAVVLAARQGRPATVALEFEVGGRRLDGGPLRLPGRAGEDPGGPF